MSQRNPMNDRYQADKLGKTRKSSASAKPKSTRAATLRDPAPKSKKQKKQEARERERVRESKAQAVSGRFEDTPGYKRLRRFWWGFIIGAVLTTAVSVLINSQMSSFFAANPTGRLFGIFGESAASTVATVCMVAAYGMIVIAFYLDLFKIRKERKLFNDARMNDNSKASTKERKRAAARQREIEREAAEKYEQSKAEEAKKAEMKAARGPLAWLQRGKKEATEAKQELQEKAEVEKERLGRE